MYMLSPLSSSSRAHRMCIALIVGSCLQSAFAFSLLGRGGRNKGNHWVPVQDPPHLSSSWSQDAPVCQSEASRSSWSSYPCDRLSHRYHQRQARRDVPLSDFVVSKTAKVADKSVASSILDHANQQTGQLRPLLNSNAPAFTLGEHWAAPKKTPDCDSPVSPPTPLSFGQSTCSTAARTSGTASRPSSWDHLPVDEASSSGGSEVSPQQGIFMDFEQHAQSIFAVHEDVPATQSMQFPPEHHGAFGAPTTQQVHLLDHHALATTQQLHPDPDALATTQQLHPDAQPASRRQAEWEDALWSEFSELEKGAAPRSEPRDRFVNIQSSAAECSEEEVRAVGPAGAPPPNSPPPTEKAPPFAPVQKPPPPPTEAGFSHLTAGPRSRFSQQPKQRPPSFAPVQEPPPPPMEEPQESLPFADEEDGSAPDVDLFSILVDHDDGKPHRFRKFLQKSDSSSAALKQYLRAGSVLHSVFSKQEMFHAEASVRRAIFAAFLWAVLRERLAAKKRPQEGEALASCAAVLLWTEFALGDSAYEHDDDPAVQAVELGHHFSVPAWRETRRSAQNEVLREKAMASWLLETGGLLKTGLTKASLFETDGTLQLWNRAYLQWALLRGASDRTVLFDDSVEIWTETDHVGTLSDVVSTAATATATNPVEVELSRVFAAQLTMHDAQNKAVLRAQNNDVCARFLRKEYNFHRGGMILRRGGSLSHGTAVAGGYDMDLTLEIPSKKMESKDHYGWDKLYVPSVGNRHIWRMAHARLQYLLERNAMERSLPGLSGEVSGGSGVDSSSSAPVAPVTRTTTRPSLAFAASGLESYNRRNGFLYSSVFDVAVYPALASRLAPAEDHSKVDAPLKDYLRSPFLVDIKMLFPERPEYEKEQLLGLRTWEVPPVRRRAPPRFLRSLDEIIQYLLEERLSANVRGLVQLAKRWSKERFPRSVDYKNPFNSVGTTLLCLRYLWLLLDEGEAKGGSAPLGKGTQFSTSSNTPVWEQITRLGIALGVRKGVSVEGQDHSGEEPARRDLVLHPGAPEREEFVLELFFGFLRFLVAEAEHFFKCKKDQNSPGPFAEEKPQKKHCVVRWHLVPNASPHTRENGFLPYHFETTEVPGALRDPSQHVEAFFSDPRPVQATLAPGDVVHRRQGGGKNYEVHMASGEKIEGVGVIQEVWMRDTGTMCFRVVMEHWPIG